MSRIKVAGETLGIGGRAWLKAGCVLAVLCSIAVGAGRSHRSKTTVPRDFFEGRELFVKVWEPGVPSPAGGDGLGPLYNETSCVGCHHIGGVGGGGGNERNVVLLTADAGSPSAEQRRVGFQGELEDLHPGFRNRSSIVLHHHATLAAVEERLTRIGSYTMVQTRDDLIALRRSSRNTPALFGAGLIDAISDEALLEAEKRQFPSFPEIKGRVSRLRDGRIGRFGWKGQTAALREFVLAACSNELGLEVPGRHQVSLQPAEEFDPSQLKLDLDEEQCNLLVKFVRTLPPPVIRPIREQTLEPWGYPVFEKIGCATCHAPGLGRANGLYSDLLLHDLGDRMSAAGGYGGSARPRRVVDLAKSNERPHSSGEAGPTEWRTPPLWGVADSAPYLHDGRAETLDEAIRLHGGEAAATSERYGKLASGDRQVLLAFLHSLTVSPKPRKSAAIATERTRGHTEGARVR
jgi:CxxC motif-containing protein (DUF1111 family)